jgi:hypothetical protein
MRPRPISLRLARVSCSRLRVCSARGSAGCLFAASALAGRSANGLARATSAPGLGSPLPLRHSACLCRPAARACGPAEVNLWISGGETVTSVHQDHSENIMHMLAGPPAAFLPGTCVRATDPWECASHPCLCCVPLEACACRREGVSPLQASRRGQPPLRERAPTDVRVPASVGRVST